jgi:drug/metabolite transporter (DMT)-like permease
MGALFALASSISYGLSDFLGGVVSRRTSFLRVAFLGQLGGFLSTAVVAPLVSTTAPATADLAWGGLSGVGTGLAMTFLFRGISRGAMSVVVPVSAVGGVALPVLVGVAVLGERPTPLAWAGVAVAVPALWAVSRGRDTTGDHGNAALPDGLAAGTGIALQYLALAQAGPDSGLWPVLAGRLTAIVAIAVLSRLLVHAVEEPARNSRRAGARAGHGLAAALAGALAALALTCYLLATRSELVAVAVVLSSLYPVVPVLLGIAVLGERLTWKQSLGLGAALTASVLIATT